MWTLLKWLFPILALLGLALLVAGQMGALRGQRPADLGVAQGRLKPPSATANSVSSQAGLYPDHPMHREALIAPFPLHGDGQASMRALAQLLASQPGAALVVQRGDYLHAEFSTPVLHFVDDVEFWADPAADVVQVRSASRIGRKDFGVNRARIESLRALWAARASGG